MPAVSHRFRKPGPEAILEEVVVNHLPDLFDPVPQPRWLGRSVNIGGGAPDILFAAPHPEIRSIAQVDASVIPVVSYLRGVKTARLETIAAKVPLRSGMIMRSLDSLYEQRIISKKDQCFSLQPHWREILSDVIAIEVKVSNWKRVVEQAARNRIFSHWSYIALPYHVAQRVSNEKAVRQLGLGVLSVSENGDVETIREARRFKPRVWWYYYEVAFRAAQGLICAAHGWEGETDGLCC